MEFGQANPASVSTTQHQQNSNSNAIANNPSNPSTINQGGDTLTRSSTPTQSQSPSVSTTPSKTRASSGRHRRSSGRTGTGTGNGQTPVASGFLPNLPSLAPPTPNFLPPPPAITQLQGGLNNALSGARRRSGKASSAQEPNLSGEKSGGDSNSGQDKDSRQVSRLNRLLGSCPSPASAYRVRRSIGFGTFSTVYLAEVKKEVTATVTSSTSSPSSSSKKQANNGNKTDLPERVAIKHLIPTSSPDRILMEVECLRLANGQENVIPLLFCHRKVGDIVLGMPFVETTKFVDALPSLTMEQCLLYMKNLLRALAYIHTLNIIHRDVKPANFLFDFQRNIFRLVDFGLAQASSEGDIKPPSPPTITPQATCKRALSARDPNAGNAGGGNDASDKESPRKRARNAAGPPEKPPRTPTRAFTAGLKQEHYASRGNAKKDLTPTCSKQTRTRQAEPTPAQSKVTTPQKAQNKVLEDVAVGGGESALPRRSPRKHSLTRKSSGFSKLTISGNAIVNATPPMASPAAVMAAASAASMKRTPSFTVLDPTSGIPSDCTPRLQASVTSRQSFGLSNFRFAPSGGSPTIELTINCECMGSARVCGKCLSRRSLKAARAGTPGFRPPEVLLKSEHQTTSVDVWAAGIILLCMLSRTYPFFRAPDDNNALAEIMCLFGTDAVREVACQYGKRLVCSEYRPPVNFQAMCRKLALRKLDAPPEAANAEDLATVDTVAFLLKLLRLLSSERVTAKEALKLPIFKSVKG